MQSTQTFQESSLTSTCFPAALCNYFLSHAVTLALSETGISREQTINSAGHSSFLVHKFGLAGWGGDPHFETVDKWKAEWYNHTQEISPVGLNPHRVHPQVKTVNLIQGHGKFWCEVHSEQAARLSQT